MFKPKAHAQAQKVTQQVADFSLIEGNYFLKTDALIKGIVEGIEDKSIVLSDAKMAILKKILG